MIFTVFNVFSFCSMEKNSAPFTPYTYVYYDGLVFDAQPVRVVSSCRLDIYMFPFDVQNCSLSFNSYVYLSKGFRGFGLITLWVEMCRWIVSIKYKNIIEVDLIWQSFDCIISFLSESAIQINLPGPAGEIFEMSKEMMATMGEWELIGITVEKFIFNADDEDVYEELRFYVRKSYTTLIVTVIYTLMVLGLS